MNTMDIVLEGKKFKVGLINKKEKPVKYTTLKGAPVEPIRVLKNTINTDFDTLTEDCTPDELSQFIIDSDLELDLEQIGQKINSHARVWLNQYDEPAKNVRFERVNFSAEGVETGRIQIAPEVKTLASEALYATEYKDLEDLALNYVWSSTLQVVHTDSLTFDELDSLAGKLHEKNRAVMVSATPKGARPIHLYRSAKSYYGALFGKRYSKGYTLLLKLTNSELKN